MENNNKMEELLTLTFFEALPAELRDELREKKYEIGFSGKHICLSGYKTAAITYSSAVETEEFDFLIRDGDKYLLASYDDDSRLRYERMFEEVKLFHTKAEPTVREIQFTECIEPEPKFYETYADAYVEYHIPLRVCTPDGAVNAANRFAGLI